MATSFTTPGLNIFRGDAFELYITYVQKAKEAKKELLHIRSRIASGELSEDNKNAGFKLAERTKEDAINFFNKAERLRRKYDFKNEF
jgi:hypothetical protein